MCDSADFPLEYGLFGSIENVVIFKSVIDIRTTPGCFSPRLFLRLKCSKPLLQVDFLNVKKWVESF